MKFIADSMLGKLCKWIRILGFSCKFVESHERDPEMMKLEAINEKRIILTRDTRLSAARRNLLPRVVFVRNQNWRKQLAQVIKEINLSRSQFRLFSRCLICDSLLINADEKDLTVVKKEIVKREKAFSKCPLCGRIYWRASHIENSRKLLDKILNEE